MLLFVLCIIAALLAAADLIQRYLKATQITTMGKLQNREKAQKDAAVASSGPKVLGTKRNRFYVYRVDFTDGTYYQDKCGIRDPKLGKHGMRFDDDRAGMIAEQAARAHEEAAAGRGI